MKNIGTFTVLGLVALFVAGLFLKAGNAEAAQNATADAQRVVDEMVIVRKTGTNYCFAVNMRRNNWGSVQAVSCDLLPK